MAREAQIVKQERAKSFTDISMQKNRIFRALNEAYLGNRIDYDTYARRFNLTGDTARQYRENIFSAVQGPNLLGWVNQRFPRSVYARRQR